jgi:hypothetical protein
MLKTWLLCLGAIPLSVSAALPPKVPAPAKIEQRFARDVQWVRAAVPGAYEKMGVKSPKWDADAKEALTAAAQLWSDDPSRPGNEHERAWQASERAMKAGCNDALVQYVHARMYALAAQETGDESARLMKAAAAAMDRSSYTPVYKFFAHARAAEAMIGDTQTQVGYISTSPETLAELDAAKALWPKVVAASDTPPETVLGAFQTYLDARHNAKGDRKTEGNALIAAVEKSSRKDAVVPLLRARLLIDLGWDARGNKRADKTSEKAMETFTSRLREAEGEVKKAVAIDPASPAIAPLMLAIHLGICCENASEAWFRYGNAVDPGSLGLWFDRLHDLEPRWNGSAEEMLAFGREAIATKQWAQRIPFVLVFAHFTLANYNDDYYKDASVCRDMHAVYEPYLKMYPDANYERSGFAALLYKCGEYPAAQRELDRLGTEVRVGPFLTRADLEYVRKDVARRTGTKIAETPGGPNTRDASGRTPLWNAVDKHDVKKVKELLAAGADPNDPGRHVRNQFDGGEPMTLSAVHEKSPEMLAALLAAGAKPDSKNMYGMNALMTAAFYGKTEMVKLLIDAKADVNATDPHGTPLLYNGVKSGNVEVVRMLLDAGAKAGTGTKKKLVLDAAKASGNEELQALVEKKITSPK